MKKGIKTLYVGAHQDDLLIGAGIIISRDPANAYTLTLCDGVSAVNYPWKIKDKDLKFLDKKSYLAQRDSEEVAAMRILGVNVLGKQFFGRIPDQRAYENISEVVDLIGEIVSRENIKRIVTHSIPEAHPDHEVACFGSHYVGRKKGIGVWEFMGYRLDESSKKFVRTFEDSSLMSSIIEISPSPQEISLRNIASKEYITQKHLIDKFMEKKELVGKRIRKDVEDLPESLYYYYDRQGSPSSRVVRDSMKDFVLRRVK